MLFFKIAPKVTKYFWLLLKQKFGSKDLYKTAQSSHTAWPLHFVMAPPGVIKLSSVGGSLLRKVSFKEAIEICFKIDQS